MSITQQDVVSAYRKLLGRDPENESVSLMWTANSTSIAHLVENIVGSDEFKNRSWRLAATEARLSVRLLK